MRRAVPAAVGGAGCGGCRPGGRGTGTPLAGSALPPGMETSDRRPGPATGPARGPGRPGPDRDRLPETGTGPAPETGIGPGRRRGSVPAPETGMAAAPETGRRRSPRSAPPRARRTATGPERRRPARAGRAGRAGSAAGLVAVGRRRLGHGPGGHRRRPAARTVGRTGEADPPGGCDQGEPTCSAAPAAGDRPARRRVGLVPAAWSMQSAN